MSNYFASLDVDETTEAGVRQKSESKKAEPKKQAVPEEPKAAAAPAKPRVAAPAEADANGVDSRAKAPSKGRGGAVTGGRGTGRAGFAGRGREFDRYSGTGRGKEVSKGGAGAHNWGNEDEVARKAEHGDEAAEGSAEEGAAVVVAAGEAAEGAGEEAGAVVVEVVPPVEEVDNTVTFEEIEKQRAAKRQGEMFAVAKEDTSKLMAQFSGLEKVQKDEPDEEFSSLLGSGKAAKPTRGDAEPSANGAASSSDLLGFRFAAPGGGDRGDRGGRGGSRGGARGGRGGPRDGPPRSDRGPPREGGAAPAAGEEGGFRGGRDSAFRGRGGGAEGGRGGRGGSSSRGGGGGDRGGYPRGGRGGRGGSGAARSSGGNLNVADANLFPALGS